MKYVSVMLMVFSIVVTGWGVMEVSRHIGTTGIQPARPMAENDSAILNMKKEAQAAEQATEKLAHLQTLLAPSLAPSPVIAIGAPPTDGKSAELASRKLTMLYFSSDFRRAMIDGQLVGAGEKLSDGSKVLSVDHDNAVIKEYSGKTTLSIPQDRIRIGTVHEKSATP